MIPPDSFETTRLTLRKPSVEDAEEIFTKYAHDAEVTKYMTWKPHQNVEETKKIIQTLFIKGWETQKEFTWVITNKDSQELMGAIFMRIDSTRGVDFGYVLARQYWGKGYMTEAVKTIVDWCLKQPSVHRVWAICDVENPASARVMKKAGLQFEGVLRKWSIHPTISDLPRDCKCYSIVK